MSSVRTRMAPSPTGEMHVGSMATLLKNYAFAKKNGGSFILRIEDTDQVREVPGATERILKTVHNYGLDWDEGPDIGGPYAPYVQSKRLDRYQSAAKDLVASGSAYYCFCTPERLEAVNEALKAQKRPPMYDGHCRNMSAEQVKAQLDAGSPFVVRLKVPTDQKISFSDVIRGVIEFDSSTINDQVLLKSDGFPTYHLGVVVDDHDMHITHIFRGEEWISSTPKHILLYKAFGWDAPTYGHIPVFLNPDGKGKMSKRKGDVAAQSFIDKGYLPEALLNFFMILGWTPEDQREIMTLPEYIQEFDPTDLSPKSVAFDLKKLDWINGVYIRNLSLNQLIQKIQPFLPEQFPQEKIEQILPLVHERLVKLSDVGDLTSFFYSPVVVSKEVIIKKADETIVSEQLDITAAALGQLKTWDVSSIEATLRAEQENHEWKKSQYFMMLRITATGREFTPPLFDTFFVIGQAEVLKRLSYARNLLTT